MQDRVHVPSVRHGELLKLLAVIVPPASRARTQRRDAHHTIAQRGIAVPVPYEIS